MWNWLKKHRGKKKMINLEKNLQSMQIHSIIGLLRQGSFTYFLIFSSQHYGKLNIAEVNYIHL